jgi:hypothetical protein
MKVYGWSGIRYPMKESNGQTREICAARSAAACARAAGMKYPRQLFNFCETGNDDEIRQAMIDPGKIFWRPLDDHGEKCSSCRGTGYQTDQPTRMKCNWCLGRGKRIQWRRG